MKTFPFAVGAAVGYILGTKAGREKYQQIVEGANTLRRQPTVQQAQSKIKDLVGQGTRTATSKLGSSTDSADTTTTPVANDPRVTPTPTTKQATE